jgi:hypothetical protein
MVHFVVCLRLRIPGPPVADWGARSVRYCFVHFLYEVSALNTAVSWTTEE